MTSMKISTMLAILLLALTSVSMGGEISGAHDITNQISNPAVNMMNDLSDSVKQISAIMNSVDNIPSCTKVASSALLSSCSQLGHSDAISIDQGLDTMLDNTKSIYATRLAVCELIEANAAVPSACSSFKPTKVNTKEGFFRGFFTANGPTRPIAYYDIYDKQTADQLDACKSSLHKQPQSWTSYSNARQNAVVMCHAMRAEIERDDAIEFHKLMMDVSAESQAKMAAANADFEAFLKDFKELRHGMHAFQVDLSAGNAELSSAIAEQWEHIRGAADEVVISVAKARQVTNDMSVDLDDYRTESELVHDASYAALKSTHEKLVHANSAATELKDFSTDNLAVGRHMSLELETMYITTAAAIELTQSLRTEIEQMRLRIDESHNHVNLLNTKLGVFTSFLQNIGNVMETVSTMTSAVLIAVCSVSLISVSLATLLYLRLFRHLFTALAALVVGSALTTLYIFVPWSSASVIVDHGLISALAFMLVIGTLSFAFALAVSHLKSSGVKACHQDATFGVTSAAIEDELD